MASAGWSYFTPFLASKTLTCQQFRRKESDRPNQQQQEVTIEDSAGKGFHTLGCFTRKTLILLVSIYKYLMLHIHQVVVSRCLEVLPPKLEEKRSSFGLAALFFQIGWFNHHLEQNKKNIYDHSDGGFMHD